MNQVICCCCCFASVKINPQIINTQSTRKKTPLFEAPIRVGPSRSNEENNKLKTESNKLNNAKPQIKLNQQTWTFSSLIDTIIEDVISSNYITPAGWHAAESHRGDKKTGFVKPITTTYKLLSHMQIRLPAILHHSIVFPRREDERLWRYLDELDCDDLFLCFRCRQLLSAFHWLTRANRKIKLERLTTVWCRNALRVKVLNSKDL